MQQSFYRKQGIDFLNFQRPGTAYGAAAFQQAAMNLSSTSFYSKGSSKIPASVPVKVPSSSVNAIKNSSMSSLWITRAEKILNQINHLYSLLDFIEYGCTACNRQLNIYKRRLQKNTTEETHFTASQRLMREMTNLYELYQAFQPDYDIFESVNQSQLVLFTEKFEHQVEDLE